LITDFFQVFSCTIGQKFHFCTQNRKFSDFGAKSGEIPILHMQNLFLQCQKTDFACTPILLESRVSFSALEANYVVRSL
jgi:hypothetical protein